MVPLFFFLLSLQRIWFRSSMDRMKDSGSFDWGSSPHGITKKNKTNLKQLVLFFCRIIHTRYINLLNYD